MPRWSATADQMRARPSFFSVGRNNIAGPENRSCQTSPSQKELLELECVWRRAWRVLR